MVFDLGGQALSLVARVFKTLSPLSPIGKDDVAGAVCVTDKVHAGLVDLG